MSTNSSSTSRNVKIVRRYDRDSNPGPSMYQKRLTKIETNCKLPGYDPTNCLKSIVAFANKKCLQTGPKLRAFIYIQTTSHTLAQDGNSAK
ncbi:tRNA (guanine-N(7)-)-methyltransferase [Trifolium repens]|nr:tRNA (guanine-N(7)-)-methyltransferase [Trifolium repens]